jgi:hypothetical protein
MIGQKWLRAEAADHEYIEQGGPGIIACKCGDWSSTTPMPATLGEWNRHREYVLTPERTWWGVTVMLWYLVGTLFFAYWTVHDFLVANRLGNQRHWDQANFFLITMAFTALVCAWFYQRFIRERDDA